MNYYYCGNKATAGDIVLVLNDSKCQVKIPHFVKGQKLSVWAINGNGNVSFSERDCFWLASRFQLIERKVKKMFGRVIRD